MASAKKNRWIKGRAIVPGVEEHILPRSNDLDNQWNTTYPYISDYDCIFDHPVDPFEIMSQYGEQQWQNLQDAKQAGTKIPINNLAHFTSKGNATRIIASGGVKGRMKKIDEDENGDDIRASLSWWSPKFTEEDINLVRNTLDKAIRPFYGDDDDQESLRNQFAESDAFKPKGWRYGDVFFEYGIDELCRLYKDYRAIGKEKKIQFKILGTYVYKQEIMYAVLVCSDEDKQFADYPVAHSNLNWVWRPQATSSKIVRLDRFHQRPQFRRWENVAFAFYVPHDVFNLPELEAHRGEL